MNRRTLIFIFFATLVISSIIPFALRDKTEPLNQTLNLTATMISSVSAMLTFAIAILLYNKFGIETPLLEKNTSVVFSFLEEIKKTRFLISSDRAFLQVRMHDPMMFEEFYSEKLLFSKEYYDGLDKLLEISGSPFMPKTISDKVDKLRFNLISFDIPIDKQKEYSKVLIPGRSSESTEYGRFNHSDMTLFEFLNTLDDIKTSTTNWIKKHSNYAPDLNL